MNERNKCMLFIEWIKNGSCKIVRSTLLNIQVCSSLSEEETLEWVRDKHPAGTTGNWMLQNKGTSRYLAPVQCADDSAKAHYVFIC